MKDPVEDSVCCLPFILCHVHFIVSLTSVCNTTNIMDLPVVFSHINYGLDENQKGKLTTDAEGLVPLFGTRRQKSWEILASSYRGNKEVEGRSENDTGSYLLPFMSGNS